MLVEKRVGLKQHKVAVMLSARSCPESASLWDLVEFNVM